MVPRACIDRSGALDNIYLIPELSIMINDHINGLTPLQSQFSSWAASLIVAVEFWSQHRDPEARMSIIDTRKYPKTGIYHVLNLQHVGLAERSYIHEYLVHGVVEGGPGSGYKSIPWTETISDDFDVLVPYTSSYWLVNYIKPLSQDQSISPLTKEEIQAAIRIALKFGPKFIVPLTASLLSHKPRSWRLPQSSSASQDVRAIYEALKDHLSTEIENYSQVTNVATDAVYTLLYEEIHQMNILLQLLAKYTRKDKMKDEKKSEKEGEEKAAGIKTKVDKIKLGFGRIRKHLAIGKF